LLFCTTQAGAAASETLREAATPTRTPLRLTMVANAAVLGGGLYLAQ